MANLFRCGGGGGASGKLHSLGEHSIKQTAYTFVVTDLLPPNVNGANLTVSNFIVAVKTITSSSDNADKSILSSGNVYAYNSGLTVGKNYNASSGTLTITAAVQNCLCGAVSQNRPQNIYNQNYPTVTAEVYLVV